MFRFVVAFIRRPYCLYVGLCRRAYCALLTLTSRQATKLLFLFGAVLLIVGLAELSQAAPVPLPKRYRPEHVRGAVALLLKFSEGSFGALLMVTSGVGAIISAAFGAYKAATSLLVTAVGSFILRALISLFFGKFGDIDIEKALNARNGFGFGDSDGDGIDDMCEAFGIDCT